MMTLSWMICLHICLRAIRRDSGGLRIQEKMVISILLLGQRLKFYFLAGLSAAEWRIMYYLRIQFTRNSLQFFFLFKMTVWICILLYLCRQSAVHFYEYVDGDQNVIAFNSFSIKSLWNCFKYRYLLIQLFFIISKFLLDGNSIRSAAIVRKRLSAV